MPDDLYPTTSILAQIRHELDLLAGQLDELEDKPTRGALACVECGAVDAGDERGWTLRLDVDDELQAFCPECDEREFGGGV